MVLRSVCVPLLCLVASAAGAVCQSPSSSTKSLRIVGGAEVQPRQYPFQVSLQDGDFHFCGGSLVAPGWVLTAAHCGDVEWVEIGAHSLSADDNCVERIRVKRTIKHPKYDDWTMENDISLLELETSSGYAPITPYFHQTAGDDLEADNTLTTVSGWGTLSSGGSSPDVLHAVNVPLVSNQVCNQAYDGGIVDSMVCAGLSKGGKDSCQGDSGGPLFVPYGGGYVQLGVVSFGEGCALPDKYGVYTRVSSHADFLCSNAGVACRDGEVSSPTPKPSSPTPKPSSPTPKPTDPFSSNDGDIDNGSLDDTNFTDSFDGNDFDWGSLDDPNFTDSFDGNDFDNGSLDDANFTDSFDGNDFDWGSFDDTTFTNFTDSFDGNDFDWGSFDDTTFTNFTDSFDGNDFDWGSFDDTTFTNFTDSFDGNDFDWGSFDDINFTDSFDGNGWDDNGDHYLDPWADWNHYIWLIENGNFGDGGWSGYDGYDGNNGGDGWNGYDGYDGNNGDGGWNGNDGYVDDNYGNGGWTGNDYDYVGGDYGDNGWTGNDYMYDYDGANYDNGGKDDYYGLDSWGSNYYGH